MLGVVVKALMKLFTRPGGRAFGVVWAGQLMSNVGSSMTSFGLAVWVYQETGSATQLGLIVLASTGPMLLVSPFVGALIDRWDRRWAMIVADGGAALGTAATLLLLATGTLEIWHLYLTLSFAGLFQAFQFPAYSAATTLMVPREDYARAAGLVQLAGSVARVVAPTAAAALVVTVGLPLIFLIDFLSFGVAVATLLWVRFPQPVRAIRAEAGLGALLREAKEGLDFVLERRALLILLMSFVVVNFAFAFQGVLALPLFLDMGSEQTAGALVSVGAFAIVIGSLALSVWGGPRNRVAGVYAPIAAMGAGMMLMGARPSIPLVVAGSILMHGTHPIAGGSSQSIWQSKVPADLQGRVFAVRQVSAIIASPIAFLGAGLLADRVFEPMMASERGLLTTLFGAGPGRGIGLLFVLSGLFALITAVVAWKHPSVRGLEETIPDLEPEPVAAAA